MSHLVGILVLMQTTHAPRRQLHIAVQETRVAHARVMANACVWSMDTNTPVDIDVFALIIAVSQGLRPNVPFNQWTPEAVRQTTTAIPEFCRQLNTFEPDDLQLQFALFLAFLSETGWRSESVKIATSRDTTPILLRT